MGSAGRDRFSGLVVFPGFIGEREQKEVPIVDELAAFDLGGGTWRGLLNERVVLIEALGGKRQSGESELRIVDLADVDPTLIDESAVEADALLASDPQLERPEHAALAAAVDELWRRYAFA